MGSGTVRREVVDDSLAGEALVTPARLSGPGIQAPLVPSPQPETMTQRITASIGKWSTDKLLEIANKQNERSLMDGAIDAVQGRTFEQLQMDGADKFALQGHRLITAQTMAAGLTASQKALITNSAYALDPDEYKAQLGQQLEMLVDGRDPRTARMIRERLTTALPELVAMHTVSNANHNEKMAFDSLVQGISAQSTDTMSVDAMLSFVAGGEGSATGGLSAARRKAAVVEGIVLSFTEGNPLAFALIQSAGLLADMNSDQLNRINDAETQYFNKNAREYNEERSDRLKVIEGKRDEGDMTAEAYEDAYILIIEEFGGRIDAAHAKDAYLSGVEPYQTGQQTRWNLTQAALARGDTKAFAAATVELVIKAESAGDPKALSDKGAEGLMQVMPATGSDPGFDLIPSDGSEADNFRFGKDYWALMIEGSGNKFGLMRWDPMDIEAAAIGYNAGFGNANKWILAGRDYSVLPVQSETEPFAKGILKDYLDREAPNRSTKLARAKGIKKNAEKVASIERWNLAARLMADEDENRLSGRIDQDTWLSRNAAIMQEYKIETSMSIVASELALTKGMRATAAKTLAKRNDDSAMAQIDLRLEVAELEYKLILQDERVGFQGMLDANKAYVAARDAAFNEFGISIVDGRNQTKIRAAYQAMLTAIPKHRSFTEKQNTVAVAVRDGAVSLLSPELQKFEHDERMLEGGRNMQEAFNLSDGGPDAQKAASDLMDDIEFAGHKNNGTVYGPARLAEGKNIRFDVILNDKEEVNPASIESIQRYIKFAKQVPFLASEFYPEDQIAFANAVVDVAGIDGNIAEALKRVHKEKLVNALHNKGLSDFIKEEETQADINRTMKRLREHEDTSLAQAAFSSEVDLPDAFRVLSSEQEGRANQESRISAALEHELRIQKVLDQTMDTDRLLITARMRLEERSDFIGGSWVYAGFNIKKEMFGDKAANFDKVGIVNEAIIAYYAALGPALKQGNVDNVGILEFLPRFMQPKSFLGFALNIDAGMSFLDAPEALLRGMRPFVSGIDGDGKMFIQVSNDQGGLSLPITLPMKEIGDFWMHRNPNFRNTDAGDPIRNPKRGAAEGTIFGDQLFGSKLGELN